MRVLLINQSFVPDKGASGQLLGDLFSRLSEAGADITVVTAPPTYTDEELDWARVEKAPNLTIYRVGPAKFRGRKSWLTRIAGYVGFLGAAFLKAGHLTRETRFDLITTASNPPFVGLIGAWLARRRGVPFVYMLHDLHPDSFMKSSGRSLPKPVVRLWDAANKAIFDAAHYVVVVGTAMSDYLERVKGVDRDKIRVIHQWAHPELPFQSGDNGYREQRCISRDSLLVLYFGNMSYSQDLSCLLDSATKLVEEPIRFVFMGDGPNKHSLELRASDLGLTNVEFVPYQQGESFAGVVQAADVCVVALRSGLEQLAVPSKTYTILSGGKAVLALLQRTSDVARIVEDHRCGWVASSADELVQVLQEALRDVSSVRAMGESARDAYVANFSLDQAVARYRALFRQAAGVEQG